MTDTVDPLLQLEGVSVKYRRSLKLFNSEFEFALKDCTFDIYRGETLGIIGSNGAGKSTLLRLLAGIIGPDLGVVTRHTQSMLLLSLSVNALPHLSGRENAIISGMLMGMRRARVESQMDTIIEFSGIGDHIDAAVRTYSSGMKARLGFAVAQQADPDLLLIDEVLSVGDSAFREKSKRAIVDRIESDRTVVLVSHNEGTVKEYCDRVIWIDEGSVRMQGATADVIDAYNR